MNEKQNKAVGKAFEIANKISQTLRKLNFYGEAGKEPPEKLMDELSSLEESLDGHVKKLLAQRENLKGDLLESSALNDENAAELEWSYQKAVCYAKSKEGLYSRLFFVPFRYEKTDGGARKNIPDFFEPKRLETFGHFVGDFVANKALDLSVVEGEEVSLEVKLRPPLYEWVVLEHEEKNLPIFHKALLDEKPFDAEEFFEAHRHLANEGWMNDSGDELQKWYVGVIPFAILSKDERLLEALDFYPHEEDFIEQFEEIFLTDGSSIGNWEAPINPNEIADKGTEMLWRKQVEIALRLGEMNRPKGGVLRADLTIGWMEGEWARLSLSIQSIDSKGDPQWAREISRWPTAGETFMDAVEWLATSKELTNFASALVVHHAPFNPDSLTDEDD